ncbi:MAG: hypothetical protein M1814_002820 [Vezdaea aestivalis]|nr:MAG: hypothetical protein M1814_002820 [Vezdaea aestivalis]
MASIQSVRASNSKLKELGPGLVAVFVGGTSGIGETTAREFIRNTVQPRIYLVGRNEAQASKLTTEFQQINNGSQVKFVKSDITLLRNVDAACQSIKASEEKINLLFLSPGIAGLGGRDETAEGLDRKFTLHYFSRWRFAKNLLPLLSNASQKGEFSRVVSVLSAGREGAVDMKDISLQTTFSLARCASHASTMNSFAAEESAAQNPGTSFIHTDPGVVDTNLLEGFGPLVRFPLKGLQAILTPWSTSVLESGERHVYASTSTSFPPKNKATEDAVTGSDGVKGSGAYLINSSCQPCGKEKILKQYRENGNGKELWKYTQDVFDRICGK